MPSLATCRLCLAQPAGSGWCASGPATAIPLGLAGLCHAKSLHCHTMHCVNCFPALPSTQGLARISCSGSKVWHAARGQMSCWHDSMLTATAKTAQAMVPSQRHLVVTVVTHGSGLDTQCIIIGLHFVQTNSLACARRNACYLPPAAMHPADVRNKTAGL